MVLRVYICLCLLIRDFHLLVCYRCMLPYFMRYDHSNYARWGVIYTAEMHQLPTDVLEEFKKGNFVVKRSSAKFNQVSPDQAQEWLNATGKKGGGIVGITKTPSALSRWALSYNLRSHIAAQTSAMFHVHHDDGLIHKETARERQKQDNEAENALHSTLQKFGVFSSQTNETLQNVATKDLATPEIEQSLVQARSLGQAQLERFVEQRLLSSEREENVEENFRDPICNNTPPTFANLYDIKGAAASSEKRMILHADRNILCRLLTAYEARREVNLQAILKHELLPVPLSFIEINQTMRTGNKAILADVVTEKVKCPESITLQGHAALFIDGFALVAAIGKPERVKSFGEFADCYVDAVLRKGSGYKRIDVLFDRYWMHSIKATTRSRRTKNTARPVRRVIEGRDVPLPIKWQAFLALGENKADLARFLSDELIAQAPADTTIVVSGGCLNEEDVLCSDPCLDVSALKSNHEEADTRFVLHGVNIERHLNNLVVYSRDTDVLLLLLAHRTRFSSKVWILAGTSKKPKYIPLEEVSANLPCNSSSALLPFHAITGCDSTSFFCGHSKKTAWKVFKEQFDLLSSVGDGILDAGTIASAEKFVCRMYKTLDDSLDLARVSLFGKVSSPEKLPPTSDAFRQHLKRCHYQTAVWRQAHIQKPVLPSPEESGWKLAEGLLVPVFMTLDPIPKACLEMISCRCTTGCATLRCKCRKSQVVCTGLCGCTKNDANCCINRRRNTCSWQVRSSDLLF